jgi:hypothetical protein
MALPLFDYHRCFRTKFVISTHPLSVDLLYKFQHKETAQISDRPWVIYDGLLQFLSGHQNFCGHRTGTLIPPDTII